MRKVICLKAVLIALAAILFAGCSKKNQEALILWTDNVEFASYAELFNASQDEIKIATVYKSELIEALPVAKGHKSPDLLAGSYLFTGMDKHMFLSVDSLFKKEQLFAEDFYTDLLNSGKKGNTQYLIPVSFNLGTLVCDITNKELVDQNSTTITFDQIKEYSKKFNKLSNSSIYTKMAFAPQWNTDFLSMVLEANNLSFKIEGETLKYNLPVLENCIDFLTAWTKEINTSCNDERDFSFKYLYTPFNKQVLQQKSLFAYTTSSSLLSLSEDQIDKIDFFWLAVNDKSPVTEDMVTMGIYKKTKNKKAALKFIKWFMNKDSQEAMLKRRMAMNLDTNTFGIANGFSTLVSVNEHILPIYYKCLLAKVPASSLPKAPQAYPSQWPVIKREIIAPQLLLGISGEKNLTGISASYTEWINQNKEE